MKTWHLLVAPGLLVDGATVRLDDAEGHHLRVRRAEFGEAVSVLDGAGGRAPGTLVTLNGRDAVAVGVVQVTPRPASTIVAAGAGDKDRFLLLAERCTELGVTRLIPIETERSQSVDTKVRGATIERARRRAREACKQSGNGWATEVEEPLPLAALAASAVGTRWLLADGTGGVCPSLAPDDSAGWIIGPEGGLTPAEIALCLTDLLATPVSLGPRVLRFDTAAVAAAVLTQDRRRTPTKE